MDNPIWSYFFRPPQEKMANIELMKELPVFESLTTGELVQIERVLHERQYSPDEVVFNEGEPGAGLYIIKKGEIAIRKKITGGDDIQLAIIPERSFFGELALLDEIPRSASACAVTQSILYGFSNNPDRFLSPGTLWILVAPGRELRLRNVAKMFHISCATL